MSKPKTAKAVSKVGHFYIETWKQNVYVLCPARSEDIASFLKKQFDQEYEGPNNWVGKCLEVATPDSGWQLVIALSDWAVAPEQISTLAHECFHAAEYLLQRRDITLSVDKTSEVFAYTTDSIMRRCLRWLMRGKKK